MNEVSSKDIKTESLWLMKGDCLERMKEIESGSVDMVLTDQHYETTDSFKIFKERTNEVHG